MDMKRFVLAILVLATIAGLTLGGRSDSEPVAGTGTGSYSHRN